MKWVLTSFALLFLSLSAHAKLVEKTVEYKEGSTILEGFLVFDDVFTGNLPAVIVVHDWMGINEFSKGRATELAKLGYVAFAADIYGKGSLPKNPEEAGKLAGKYKNDRPLLRKRIQAAWDLVRAQKNVAKDRIAAIGYCFGGTTVLELARTGAPLKSVVSFHGGLDSASPTGKKITAKVLVLHGADDPHVPPEQVAAFEKEMREGKVDWMLTSYGNAVHAFAVPDAGSDNSKGAAYNKTAADRSWAAMKQFFTETL